MQPDYPQTFKYLSELNLFAIYTDDYSWCHELLGVLLTFTQHFSQTMQEFHEKLLMLVDESRDQLSRINSKVVRNIADVHLRKVSQATEAVKSCDMSGWLAQPNLLQLFQISQRSICSHATAEAYCNPLRST